METLTPVILMTFMTAITQPLFACICMATLIFGRLFYSLGYCNAGPKGRIAGALIADLAILALLVGCILTLVNWPKEG